MYQSALSLRKEIGSEFWDIPLSKENNTYFPADTSWFLSGRSALSAIIQDIRSKRTVNSVLLPAWCCDSMILPFLNAGLSVQFYPVYMENGMLQQRVPDGKPDEIVFLMDYFGYRSEVDTHNYNGVVIRDLTHSFFSGTYNDADYYFGSLRKWAGFWTGGIAKGLATEIEATASDYVSMRQAAMRAKSDYIAGISSSKDYLRVFQTAEEYLEHYPVSWADERDIYSAQYLNISFIKETRRKNAAVLLNAFSDIAIFPQLHEDDCPLFVPVLVPKGKRDELRRHLIQKEIYCPVHWPLTEYHRPGKQTLDIYENELSLVCDQRYSENDMERIVDAIRTF